MRPEDPFELFDKIFEELEKHLKELFDNFIYSFK